MKVKKGLKKALYMRMTLDVPVLIVIQRLMSTALMPQKGFHVLRDVVNSVEVHVEKRGGVE